jgi:hypothetical protein
MATAAERKENKATTAAEREQYEAVAKGRKEVGKDFYGNPVFEGQVEGKDAHGNRVFRDPDVGSGPDHHKDKHPKGVNTGKKDAHGNEIWETPGAKKDED